jgi:hypothetical protein
MMEIDMGEKYSSKGKVASTKMGPIYEDRQEDNDNEPNFETDSRKIQKIN